MYVCLCRGVRASEVAEAIREGARTVGQVGRACGAGVTCGGCRPVIHDLLVDHGAGQRRSRSDDDDEHVVVRSPGSGTPLAS